MALRGWAGRNCIKHVGGSVPPFAGRKVFFYVCASLCLGLSCSHYLLLHQYIVFFVRLSGLASCIQSDGSLHTGQGCQATEIRVG